MKQGFVELVAVTTAEGNVNAKTTFACASQVLHFTGFVEIELGKGVVEPTDMEDAAYIHGADGMGGLSESLPSVKHDYGNARYSDDIIIDKLNAHPGEITLLAVAPLTNLAAAEMKSPGILRKAKEIIVMGGAFEVPGNVTSLAEFNIAFNVDAAQLVFNSRNDTVVLSLDVTNELIFTKEMAEEVYLSNSQNPVAKFIVQLCEFLTYTTLTYRQSEGVKGFLVHDAATVAYLFYPETLLLQRAQVDIETAGKFTKGQTIIDNRHVAKHKVNAWVALQVDAVNLLASLVEDLKVLLTPNSYRRD